MLVYGDLVRRVRPADLLAEVEADLAAGDALAALIGLGQLAQGLADAEFEARGCDARSPATDALMEALTDLARHLPSPLEGEGPGMGERSSLARLPELLRRLPPIPTLPPRGGKDFEVRIPEGYAFYALHPAAYAAAAARLPPGDWRVIGVRSIGASLAAVAAAALGAPPPVTVRPVGPPFARRLRLAPELQAEWAAHPGPFAVVDEGPGLSGSSFGAVADALEASGAARGRIAFLPGHDGDLGPRASPAHRARWRAATRPVARFEDAVLPRVAVALEQVAEVATGPLRDISGGRWRAHQDPGATHPPPADAARERRKFLMTTADGPVLLKFTGLGRIGRDKLAGARALHAAGFTPEPLGLAEGFLAERWLDASRALDLAKTNRAALLHRLGDYLAFRARALPAASEAGAPPAALWEMTRVNAAEALGPAAVEALPSPDLSRLAAATRRVQTDGRLHAWEWRVASDGRLLKTDALDHCESHDLIGAQDVAWDVAGAEVEFDLDADETEPLRRRVGAQAELLAFLRPAYLAFQLGLWTQAVDACADRPEEAARLRAQAGGYARRLAALLGVDPRTAPG